MRFERLELTLHQGDGKKRARYFDPPCSTEGTWYNWDMGWTIINEEAGADGTGALERTYVGKTLAHADGTNPGTGTWRYYHMDAQGSAGLVTDPSQTVKAAFAYRPYGELYANTGSEVDDITHRYAQLEWDPTVVQYYAPYRWYHPRLSRWTTRDPLGMVDGPNVYAYVMGNPVNLIDPMGLDLIDLIWTGEWNPDPDEWQEAYGSLVESDIKFYVRGNGGRGSSAVSYDPIDGSIDASLGAQASPSKWPKVTAGMSGNGPQFLNFPNAPDGLNVSVNALCFSFRYKPNGGNLAVGISSNPKINVNVRQDIVDAAIR